MPPAKAFDHRGKTVSAHTATMHDSRILLPCAALGFLIFFLLEKSVVLGLAVVLVLGLFALVSRWPELGTLIAQFAIYSNIAVLGMKSRAILQTTVQTGQMTISTAGQNARVVVVMAALCLVLCIPLLYQFLVRKEKLTFDRGFYLMLGYFAVFLTSSFFARDNAIVSSQITDFLLEGMAIYFLVVNVVREYATLRRATWALLLAGSFMGGLSVFQHVTHTETSNYGGLAMLGAELDFDPIGRRAALSWADAENLHPQGATSSAPGVQFRSAGPIGEPNRYAQVLVVLLPLAALRFRRERSRALRWFALACGAFILGGMVLTFSRGAMFTAVIIFGLLAYFRFIRPLHVVVAAWRVFLDYPILGVGPGHFSDYYSIAYCNRVGLIEQLKKYRGHNLYLETLAETGILGLASCLAIILAIMHGLWKIWKKLRHEGSESSDVAMAFFLCLVAYLISAIFAHMSYQRYFWLLMALSSATIHILGTVEQETSSELGPA